MIAHFYDQCIPVLQLLHQMVGNLTGRLQGLHIFGQIIISHQPQHAVLATPDIPALKMFVIGIISDVSVGSLCDQQSGHRLIKFFFQFRFRPVTVSQHSGGEPFTPELALPATGFGMGAEYPNQAIHVLRQDPVLVRCVEFGTDIIAYRGRSSRNETVMNRRSRLGKQRLNQSKASRQKQKFLHLSW